MPPRCQGSGGLPLFNQQKRREIFNFGQTHAERAKGEAMAETANGLSINLPCFSGGRLRSPPVLAIKADHIMSANTR